MISLVRVFVLLIHRKTRVNHKKTSSDREPAVAQVPDQNPIWGRPLTFVTLFAL